MMEFFAPSLLAFSKRFKCPVIGMASLDAPSPLYELVGNPSHPVANPDVNIPFSEVYMLPSQQVLVDKHFGTNLPKLTDMIDNTSLLFVNSDPIFSQIRPLVPVVVQIGGGTHRRPSKALPKDLQELLDNATQGFVYFSLGTNVKSKDLPRSTQTSILEAFAELPYLVLWKFELEVQSLPIKPKNVLTSKWYPQQDVFKHPNIKLFITQGGQQSMEEAIYDHVPMVGMPFAGDQLGNVKRFVAKGLGLSVEYQTLEKENFKNTILEVINNPKYRNKVKELANLAKDQPMTGLEKAVWWTEYVLRHKGARHLRSPALDIPWYQYFLLDVIGFCLIVVFISIYLLITLVRILCKLIKYFTLKPKVKIQ